MQPLKTQKQILCVPPGKGMHLEQMLHFTASCPGLTRSSLRRWELGKGSISLCVLHGEDTFLLGRSSLCSLSGLFKARDEFLILWNAVKQESPLPFPCRVPGMVHGLPRQGASPRDAGQDPASLLHPECTQAEHPSLACPHLHRPDLVP